MISLLSNLEQCQAPLAISHANIAPAKHLHNQGSNVHYACEVGYTLQGNSMRTCGPQGQWIGPDPSCVCSVALMNGKDLFLFCMFISC